MILAVKYFEISGNYHDFMDKRDPAIESYIFLSGE